MTGVIEETASEAVQAAGTAVRGATLPVRLIIGAVAALAGFLLVIFVLGRLGFHFDPLNLTKKRAEHAEATATNATSDADARGIESTGERDSARRAAAAAERAADAAQSVAALAQTARTAPDANDLIPADRVARLRAHDDELCRLDPALVGCPAAAGNAQGGH